MCTLIIRLCGLCRFALPLGEFQRKSKSHQRRHFRFQLIIVVLMVWFCWNCLVGIFALQVSHNCTCFEMCAVQAQSKAPELTVKQKGFSASTLTSWHLCLSCKFIHISIWNPKRTRLWHFVWNCSQDFSFCFVCCAVLFCRAFFSSEYFLFLSLPYMTPDGSTEAASSRNHVSRLCGFHLLWARRGYHSAGFCPVRPDQEHRHVLGLGHHETQGRAVFHWYYNALMSKKVTWLYINLVVYHSKDPDVLIRNGD